MNIKDKIVFKTLASTCFHEYISGKKICIDLTVDEFDFFYTLKFTDDSDVDVKIEVENDSNSYLRLKLFYDGFYAISLKVNPINNNLFEITGTSPIYSIDDKLFKVEETFSYFYNELEKIVDVYNIDRKKAFIELRTKADKISKRNEFNL